MGVEIVLHEPNLLRLRVARRELLHKLGVLALGALGPHLVKALPGQGLHGGQHAATAVFGVGIVLPGGLTWLRGQALDDVAEQKTGSLIEAADGKARLVGAGIEQQQGLEAAEVLAVDLTDAPLAL